MAEAFTVSETIAAPPEQVWAVLTDWSRAPEWMSGIEALAADGPLEVGTELRFTARGRERPSEIAALDDAGAVTLRSQQGKVTADYRYRLSAAGDGTRAELSADCRTEGAIMALAAPLLRYVMKRTDGGQMASLKRLVEAERASGPAESEG